MIKIFQSTQPHSLHKLTTLPPQLSVIPPPHTVFIRSLNFIPIPSVPFSFLVFAFQSYNIHVKCHIINGRNNITVTSFPAVEASSKTWGPDNNAAREAETNSTNYPMCRQRCGCRSHSCCYYTREFCALLTELQKSNCAYPTT